MKTPKRHTRKQLPRCVLAGVLLNLAACPAKVDPPATAIVKLGIDTLMEQDFELLDGKRVGLITNPSGVTCRLRSTVDVLHRSSKVQLVALFGPEHGVRGDAHAGDNVADASDPQTGLPTYSLYGQTRKPDPTMLEGIDTLVFDIQDIGSRSYTFISTMALAMEAAAEHNIEFVVLDRPNPMNGKRVEGRPLDLAFQSFVGQLPIPYVHGLTVGELARMVNGEGWLSGGVRCELTVVPMTGWRRDMHFDETGLPWVPTSPHLPRADSPLFYAATGIMGELRVISEGVGYPLPFELAGAKEINAEAMAKALNDCGLPGVYFRPTYFKLYYTAAKDAVCGGVQIHLIDRDAAQLTWLQFHIMDYFRKHHPERKLFGKGRDEMFDKVCGTDRVRQMFESGQPVERIIEFWSEGVDTFRRQRAKYLLYD